MSKNAMAVVFATPIDAQMNELTLYRAVASLPFAGRYRCVDFILSNLVNSGVSTIEVVTRENYNSLLDHLRQGRDWNLARKNSGLTIFPPHSLSTQHDVYHGRIDALYAIARHIRRTREDYIIVADSNVIFNVDFEELLERHIKSGADITALTHKTKEITSRKLIYKSKGECVDSVRVALGVEPADDETVGLNVYIANKNKLLDLIEYTYARGKTDFEKDVLLDRAYNIKLREERVEGYCVAIDNISGYYRHNMELLNESFRRDLFYANGDVLTKVKDSAPTLYREGAVVKNSLIADGCVIEGSVENSVLFRGVRVKKGAVVKNSIVMEYGIIETGASLNYVIADKEVVVSCDKNISSSETYPMVIAKKRVV